MKRASKPRLAGFGVSVAVADVASASPPEQNTNPHYFIPEHRAWRATVIRRADARCEWVEKGKRCEKSEATGHRMFAHHVDELGDAGAAFDPKNGKCLCGSHHTIITN